MALTQRLEVFRGTTARWKVAVTDEDGAPVDLTGATIYFTVRKRPSLSGDDTDAVLQKAVGDGIDV